MSDHSSEKLDFKAVFSALTLPIIFWGLSVGAITAFGYPGVICITPMAWLLSITVAQTCIHRSRSRTKRTRVREAGTAGGILGALEGLLFTVISLVGLNAEAGEMQPMLWIGVIMLIIGTGVCAIVAAAFANFIEIRRANLADNNENG